jgi:cytoskeletal protein CcmA (bactofilin family)
MEQGDLTGLGELHALLGRGSEFEGVLSFEGRVRIDGRFKGRIHSDGLLVLGEGAEVEAEIEVGTLIVRGGTLRGNVVARQLIEIHAEGRVHGDITAPQIDMDKGCLFEGRCSMAQKSDASEPSQS